MQVEQLDWFSTWLALQLQPWFFTSAFLCCSPSRIINQDLPHDAGRDGQKMALIRKLLPRVSTESQVRFMNERSRLQSVVRPLPTNMPGGNAVQFVINHRGDFVHDGLIPSAEPLQKLGYGSVHNLFYKYAAAVSRSLSCWMTLASRVRLSSGCLRPTTPVLNNSAEKIRRPLDGTIG